MLNFLSVGECLILVGSPKIFIQLKVISCNFTTVNDFVSTFYSIISENIYVK